MLIILKGPFFVEFQTCQSPSKIFTKKCNKTKVTKTKDIKNPAKYLGNPTFLCQTKDFTISD